MSRSSWNAARPTSTATVRIRAARVRELLEIVLTEGVGLEALP